MTSTCQKEARVQKERGNRSDVTPGWAYGHSGKNSLNLRGKGKKASGTICRELKYVQAKWVLLAWGEGVEGESTGGRDENLRFRQRAQGTRQDILPEISEPEK